jgi:hypothetical protein
LVAAVGNVAHEDAEARDIVEGMLGEELKHLQAGKRIETLEGADSQVVKSIRDMLKVIIA